MATVLGLDGGTTGAAPQCARSSQARDLREEVGRVQAVGERYGLPEEVQAASQEAAGRDGSG